LARRRAGFAPDAGQGELMRARRSRESALLLLDAVAVLTSEKID
jgi:hypothetical protein